jgi:flagellar hook-basal body protein
MIGALWTGISGLSSQQKALDNESNNIANVNTIGFKSSRISFADQMYQDRIGKGSKILDAEKLYTQGNLKLTGVNYDMALSGDGFFTVLNNRSSGSSETLYTRAGNFRMGDNGTLQDAAGNEVQGWPMTAIDNQNDVTSTNPNVKVFDTDYSKLLGSKVIKHDTYIETITAKATDYSSTAKSDSGTVFSGTGMKTKSAKIADIETAITDYTNWLQKLKDEPDGLSATSISQISQINFKTGSDGIISKDGDQIYVYINGSKVSQNYVVTTASASDIEALDDATFPDTSKGGSGAGGVWNSADYDKAVSRIATYKALADKISSLPGLVASMTTEHGGQNDVLESTDTFYSSTKIEDMYKGILQIKSLIPGKSFTLSEVAEISGTTTSQGNFLTTTPSSQGSGIGAVESARDALSKLMTGKQKDVYTPTDLNLASSSVFNYSINIYDKELGKNIPVPNNNATIPTVLPITITATTVDEFINQFNTLGSTSSPKLTDYVKAENVNGNVVIKTLDKNYDVEFSSSLKQVPSVKFDLSTPIDNATYAFQIGDLKNFTFNTANSSVTKQSIYDTVKTNIDVYNATASAENQLSIVHNSDYSSFSIYTNNESISFSNSAILVNGTNIPTSPGTVAAASGTTTVLDSQNVRFMTTSPTDTGTYSIVIDGVTLSSTQTTRNNNASPSDTDVYNDLISQVNSNSVLKGYMTASIDSTLGGIKLDHTKLKDVSTPGYTSADLLPITVTGLDTSTSLPLNTVGTAYKYNVPLTLANTNSSSVFTLTIDGINLSVQTDQDPTVSEIKDLLNIELAKNAALSSKIQPITVSGSNLVIDVNVNELGYNPFTVVTGTFTDIDKSISKNYSDIKPLDKNANYSGREGAGAEFIEIINKVDQTASKGSLQLRLDTLGISDTAFGEFSVDSTGLITMKQDGAEFAIGQVAIALFNNNQGLNPVGDNLLAKSNDSGEPIYNINNNKTAKIEGKTLELSTADLSESLVNLMVFQRAFEANAKSITTSDELLNTLINLKR